MKKLLCWSILGYLAILLLFPFHSVLADISDTIRITATGSNVTGISNFTVVASDIQDTSFQADGTWDNPPVLDYVVIRRSFTDYPSSPTDGEAVYQGTGEAFSEIIDTTEEQVYYSAWVYSGGSYSPPAYYLLEVESGMVSVLTLLVFILLAIAPTIGCFAVSNGRTVLSLVAAFGWLMLGVYSYTQSTGTWDIYYSLGFMCLWLVALFVFIPAAYWYQRKKEEASIFQEETENWGKDEPLRKALLIEQRDQERMDRAFGKSKPRVKKKRSKFSETGEI